MEQTNYITHLPLKLKQGYKSFITSPFGPRILNGVEGFHSGVDLIISNEKSHEIANVTCCFKSAVIIFAGSYGTAGNSIVLLEKDKSQRKLRLMAVYCHLERIFDNIGDIVKGDEEIGIMGGTGVTQNQYGKHLHFGLNLLEKDILAQKAISGIGAIDPMLYGLQLFQFTTK